MRATVDIANFSVLAREGKPVATSADVVLEAMASSKTRGDLTVRLTGDLYMTRTEPGWKIIGFRLLNETSGPDTPAVTTSAASR
jgi:hypothetical protein